MRFHEFIRDFKNFWDFCSILSDFREFPEVSGNFRNFNVFRDFFEIPKEFLLTFCSF